MKNIRVFFLSENVQFLEVKFSIYLNRRVFVMNCNPFRVAYAIFPQNCNFWHRMIERCNLI